MKPRRKMFALILLGALVVGGALGLLGIPQRALLGYRLQTPPALGLAPPQPGAFPHGELEALLLAHVDEQGRVDYPGLHQERAALERYVAQLAAWSPRSHPALFPSRAHAMAYDINAYNALVLWGVLLRWPLGSVQEVPPGGLIEIKPGQGFFYSQRFVLGGEEINLYDLEHRVLRPYGDARIHAAINCASASCPQLQRRVFTPEGLEAQLAQAMAQMVSQDKHLEVDERARVVRASAIFDWFEEDFVAHAPSLLEYWAQVAPPGPRREALERARRQGYAVQFKVYDWTINAR